MEDRKKPVISDRELFHVHTFRCRHAEELGIPLEQNESSKATKNYFREEFWKLANGKTDIICGLDAHFIRELKLV